MAATFPRAGLTMADLPYIDRTRLLGLVPMIDAIDALEHAFTAGLPALPLRTVHATGTGQLLLMPAWSEAGLGVKLITYTPDNARSSVPIVQGVYVLFAPDTSTPLAIFDGSAITELRTAAVSGVATRHLAPPGAAHLSVFGTGVQARSHVRAMQAVRPIEHVTVVSRDPGRAIEYAAELRNEGLDAQAIERTVSLDAQIVCLCTTSPTPVLNLGQLSEPAHINAIGSFQPHTSEVDAETVCASAVFVEDRAAAMDEAGDLIMPEAAGVWDRSRIAGDLHELVTQAPPPAKRISLFKGVGLAYEDLVVANRAFAALNR